jgi:hypothetical protein
MSTTYTVFSAFRISGEELAVAGGFEGEMLEAGQQIRCVTLDASITLEVVSLGIVDPNLVKETKRQGIVARVLSGNVDGLPSSLEGLVFKTRAF